MTAKTNAEKQADLRASRLAEGMTEVRGIYAKPEDHAKIKAFAKKLAKPVDTVNKNRHI